MPAGHRRTTNESRRSELLEISNALVRLYNDQFDRGPTKARTRYADADTIISTLENTLTPTPKKLCDLGQRERAEETRPQSPGLRERVGRLRGRRF